jgi:hypothetical protein
MGLASRTCWGVKGGLSSHVSVYSEVSSNFIGKGESANLGALLSFSLKE